MYWLCFGAVPYRISLVSVRASTIGYLKSTINTISENLLDYALKCNVFKSYTLRQNNFFLEVKCYHCIVLVIGLNKLCREV